MEFIPMVHPAQSASADLKRQAHSHAARVAHARARKLRVTDYMHQKGIIRENPHEDASDHQPQNQTQMAVARQQHKQALVSRDDITPLAPGITSSMFDHGPFASFIESLTFIEHFMFNHYVTVVVPYLNDHCPVMQSLGEYHEHVRKNWIFFSSTDADLLKGFLLAACRHLSMVNLEKVYAQFAIQYKLSYVQSLRETLSSEKPSLSRMAVTKALVLALDEVMLGDLSMASKHVLGAVHIVQMAGGPQALGLSAFVIHILHSCVYGKRLLDWDPVIRCSVTFMKPRLTRA